MQIGLTSPQRRKSWRILIASLMTGLLLVVSGLAVSPCLHHLFHQDSDNSSHTCLITQYGQGSLLLSLPVEVVIEPPPVFSLLIRLPENSILRASDYALLPSRGPPAFSSFTIAG